MITLERCRPMGRRCFSKLVMCRPMIGAVWKRQRRKRISRMALRFIDIFQVTTDR
jgi:hypothetical protein